MRLLVTISLLLPAAPLLAPRCSVARMVMPVDPAEVINAAPAAAEAAKQVVEAAPEAAAAATAAVAVAAQKVAEVTTTTDLSGRIVEEPFTLATLPGDLFQICMLATVGLAGAYVTQGSEGGPPADPYDRGVPRDVRRRGEPPQRQQSLPWQNEDLDDLYDDDDNDRSKQKEDLFDFEDLYR